MPTPLEVVHRKHVASTSSLAGEWARRRPPPGPFVVTAEEQGKGRGRYGHSWWSPRGNLYATFGWPLSEPPAPDAALRVGVLVGRWLHSEGVRVTLKWPNDVLLGGAKLGGILCELLGAGGSEHPFLLAGIGINVARTPSDLPYPATSLSASFPYREWSADVLRQSLQCYWQDHWEHLLRQPLGDAYEGLRGQQGTLWRVDGTFYRDRGTTAAGELQLRPLAGGADRTLQSTRRDCRWPVWPLLIGDCGNSTLVLGRFDTAGGPSEVRWWPHGKRDAAGELQRWRESWDLPRGWPLTIGSVAPDASACWEPLLEQARLVPRRLPKTPVRLRLGDYPLAQLGVDRLGAMEGWLARCAGEREGAPRAVVVCCGTATTVDLLDDEGGHRGGTILPGLQTALDALSSRCRGLPALAIAEAEVPGHSQSGQSTAEAMTAGVLGMTRCWIEAAARGLGAGTKIVVTGGLAPRLTKGWDAPARFLPNLALEGFAVVAVGPAAYPIENKGLSLGPAAPLR